MYLICCMNNTQLLVARLVGLHGGTGLQLRSLTARYDSDASTCSSFSCMFSCTAAKAATGFLAAAATVLFVLTG